MRSRSLSRNAGGGQTPPPCGHLPFQGRLAARMLMTAVALLKGELSPKVTEGLAVPDSICPFFGQEPAFSAKPRFLCFRGSKCFPGELERGLSQKGRLSNVPSFPSPRR